MKQPDEIGGAETQSLYLIVSDADVVYRRAKSGGAEMLIDIRDESYGGRGFTCRDPEGHIWSRAGALNVSFLAVSSPTCRQSSRVLRSAPSPGAERADTYLPVFVKSPAFTIVIFDGSTYLRIASTSCCGVSAAILFSNSMSYASVRSRYN